MSDLLTAAKRRESTKERADWRQRYALNSDRALLTNTRRNVDRALTEMHVRVSPFEAQALTASVVEKILSREGLRRGRPVDVLAHIDRAERMPTFIAQREHIARGREGYAYVKLTVRALLADSREWRDLAETFKGKRGQNASAVVSAERSVSAATGEPVGWLAESIARESAGTGVPTLAPVSVDRYALADALTAAVSPESKGDRAALRTALLASLADDADADEGALALATELGVTYGTLRNRMTRGRKLWTDAYPDAADAVAAVRAAAEALALAKGERSARELGEAPALGAVAMAAMGAAESAKREQGKRTHGYLSGSRQTYSPATARATRISRGPALSPHSAGVIGCVTRPSARIRPVSMVARVHAARTARSAVAALTERLSEAAAVDAPTGTRKLPTLPPAPQRPCRCERCAAAE